MGQPPGGQSEMKPGAGQRKGNRFENETARALSLWITRGRDATQLISTRLSGGWSARLLALEPWRQVGDIAPNGPAGDAFRAAWAVECKRHQTIDLWHYWTSVGGQGSFEGWWRKLRAEVEGLPEPRPAPMLIMRANHRPAVVVIPEEWARALRAAGCRVLVLSALRAVVVQLVDLMVLPPEKFTPELVRPAGAG